MSRVYYCTECGTIKPPHYRAEDHKPCCPDNYAIPCDLTIADQARFGFKVDLIIAQLSADREAHLKCYAKVLDTPTDEAVKAIREIMDRFFK